MISLAFVPTASAFNVNLDALAMVESGGNPKAIGDNGLALGEFQLHKEAVLDANRFLKAKFKHKDALEPRSARIIADAYINGVLPAYLKRMKIPDTLETRLSAYNQGIGFVKRGVVATSYIKKYKKAVANVRRG